MEPELKKYYFDRLDEIEIGNIVLLFLDENNNWTVLGTNMVAHGNESELKFMSLKNIDKMQPKAITDTERNLKFEKQSIRKGEWSELLVIDKNQDEIILTSKKGSDFFAMWSILLMLSRLRK